MRRGSAVVLAAASLAAALVPARPPSAPLDDLVVTVTCSVAYADDDGCEVPTAVPLPQASAGTPAGSSDDRPSPPRLTGAQRPFGWTENVEAVCITFVQGVAPRQALAALVPEPAYGPGRPAAVWRRSSDQGGDGLALAGTARGWTYVWQENRWSCAMPGTVRALRGARRFISVYWNVNAVTKLAVAERGRVVRDVDVVVDEAHVGRPRASERGLDWRGWRSALLAVLERETGVRITDADWALRRATVGAVEPL